MAPPVLTISTARQTFFDLFESVTTRRGRKVIITSRGAEHRAVLVEETYLSELEAAARRLRDLESGGGVPRPEFRLIGSGRPTDETRDPLSEIRSEAEARWLKKLTSIGH